MIKKSGAVLLLSLLCMAMLLASLPVDACADGPGKGDIYNAYNADSVQFPSQNNFLDDYETRYIQVDGNSVYVHYWPSVEKGYQKVIFKGQRVTRLAKQNGFSFILYWNQANELYAGWVSTARLTKTFPGQKFSTGARKAYSGTENIGDAAVSWSKNNFSGTRQKYSVLDEPVEDCVGFTLDYMVTSRNGATSKQCLGTRTIYVYDGSSWHEAGTFRYSKLGPVHVEVSLDKPMRIEAVATKADCAKPDKLSFRQSILDVICLQ